MPDTCLILAEYEIHMAWVEYEIYLAWFLYLLDLQFIFRWPKKPASMIKYSLSVHMASPPHGGQLQLQMHHCSHKPLQHTVSSVGVDIRFESCQNTPKYLNISSECFDCAI